MLRHRTNSPAANTHHRVRSLNHLHPEAGNTQICYRKQSEVGAYWWISGLKWRFMQKWHDGCECRWGNQVSLYYKRPHYKQFIKNFFYYLQPAALWITLWVGSHSFWPRMLKFGKCVNCMCLTCIHASWLKASMATGEGYRKKVHTSKSTQKTLILWKGRLRDEGQLMNCSQQLGQGVWKWEWPTTKRPITLPRFLFLWCLGPTPTL